MIDFNAKLPDVTGYKTLNDGTILSPDEYQAKLANGSLQEVTVDPNENNFKRSLGIGVNQLKAAGYGTLGLLGDAVDNNQLKNYGLNNAQNQLNIASLYARPDDQIQNINSLGGAGNYVVNAIGTQLPGLAAGLLTGGVGAVIGKKVATSLIGAEVDSLVAKQLASTGFKAGLFAQGVEQSAGTIYPQAIQNHDLTPVASALVGGTIGGALNFLGDNAILNNFKNPAQGASFLSRLGKNVGIDASAQGAAGLGQSINDRFFSNRDLTSQEAYHEYLNAAAQGAIGGAGFGAINAFRKAEAPSEIAPEKPIDTSTTNPDSTPPLLGNDIRNPLLLENGVERTSTDLAIPRKDISRDRRASIDDFNLYTDDTPLLENSQLKLADSNNFKRIAQDRPELADIANEGFNEQKLLDSGVSKNEVSSIKQELKVQDLSTKDIGGYTVAEILSKDISNFSPEEISAVKSKVKEVINSYDDTKLANQKIVADFNKALDARYKDSIENPNTENQLNKISEETQNKLNEKNEISQEKMALDESQPKPVNTPEEAIANVVEDQTLSKLTPEEQLQNQVKGADNEKVIKSQIVEEGVDKNIETAQKDSGIVEPIKTNEDITRQSAEPKVTAEITRKEQLARKGLFNKDFIEKINSSETLKEAHRIDPKSMENAYKNTKDINELNKVAENIIKNKDIVFAEKTQSKDFVRNEQGELSTKEKLQVNKVSNIAKESLKNANVNLRVINSKDSPFIYRDINGYYDPNTNTVVLIADKVGDTKAQVQSILNHELLHAGIYKMVKGNDRVAYESQMENLAKNKPLDDLARQLEQDSLESGNPLSRPASIEEALAKFAESGDFRNLTGIDKFINYVKKLINKILGGDDLVTDNDVQSYLARATEFTIDDSNAKTINDNSFMQSHEYVNDTGNMPKDIMFSENYDNKQAREVNEAIKDFVPHVQAHEDLKSSTEFKSFFDKVNDKTKGLINTVSNKDNRHDAWNGITRNLSSMRELVQKSPIAQALQNIFDMSETLRGGLDSQTQENVKILRSKLKAVSDFDNKSVSQIMADFALQKNEGNGIRPSEQQIREAIANFKDVKGKEISNKQGAYELYQARRASADLLVHKVNQSKIQNQINFIERKIESSSTADRNIITQLKTAINNVNNAKEFSDAIAAINRGEDYNTNIQKLSDHYKEFYAKLDSISKLDVKDTNVQLDFNERMNNVKDTITQANKLVNENGYLPKDHSGKYTIQLALKYFDENGEPKKVIFGVHASDSFLKRNQYLDSFKNSLNKLVEKGLIKDVNDIEVTPVDRSTEQYSNLNADQFINMAERKGIELTDDQIKNLQSVSETYKILDRSFKTGVGYSLDFDKAIFRQLRTENTNISRGVNYNREINTMKNVTGWEKDLMVEMQNAKQQVNNTDAISSKLRGLASLWYLGYNASSASMQVMQMLQAAPSWIQQFSGGTGMGVTMQSLKKAAVYLKNGTTGDKALDQAIKDFTNPLLGAGENELLFNINKDNEFSNRFDSKSLLNPYGLFSKAEELSRLTTFLASHEVFHNRDQYQSRVAIGDNFHEFAINNLIKVNGDYSAYNRPKAFQGPVAQTLFQFKQYMVFMNEMFQHMDTKAKGSFLATLLISGGINGLPFAQNIEDGIDFLLKMFHLPYSIRGSIDSHLKDLGKSMGFDSLATYAQNGIVPSIGIRAGVGDVIPFLGPVLDIASGGDVAKSLQSSIGPVGSVTVNMATGLGKLADSSKDLVNGDFALLRSDMTSAIKQLSPNALKNVIKGGEQMLTGYSINTGETALNKKTDMFDSILQMFGYQTASLIESNQNNDIIRQAKDLKKNISKYFKNEYLQAKLVGNEEGARQNLSNAREFNRMAKIDKSGYDFNINVLDWNKQARLNSSIDLQTRGIKGSDNSLKKALSEDLNLSSNLTNNLTVN